MKAGINILSLIAALFLAFLPVCSVAAAVPTLSGRVNDYAHLLNDSAIAGIEAELARLDTQDSTQIVVLTIDSLDGEPIEEFALKTAQKWLLGQNGIDNWALLVVARNERKIRIEVGYGLEGKLTDLLSGRIIRDIMVPEFKRGNFSLGIQNAVKAMVGIVSGEYTATNMPGRSSRGSGDVGGFMVIAVFVMTMVGRIFRSPKILAGIAGAVLLPLLGVLFLGTALGSLMLLLIPIGFVVGMFSTLFGRTSGYSGRHYSSGGYGGFGGGDFGGGGFSGGGGGGGGGGGASGGW